MGDPCECFNSMNTRMIISQILNLVNNQPECTDTHCFTPNDVGQLTNQIDPIASISTITVALIGLLVVLVLFPINGRRRQHRQNDEFDQQRVEMTSQKRRRGPDDDRGDNREPEQP